MNNTIFDLFNIDNTKYKALARVTFILLFVINLQIVFLSFGDSNFDRYFTWCEKLVTASNEGNIEVINELFSYSPISRMNLIYLINSLAVELLTVACSVFYCAFYIKGYRSDIGKESISWGKMIVRVLVFFTLLTVFFAPLAIMLLSLFLFFIIILPYVIMYPACYLSGDYNLLTSFKMMISKSQGYYLVNAKNLFVIILISFISSWIIELLARFSSTSAYVFEAFVYSFISLAIGRYIGMTYCRIVDAKKGVETNTES